VIKVLLYLIFLSIIFCPTGLKLKDGLKVLLLNVCVCMLTYKWLCFILNGKMFPSLHYRDILG